jgi:glycerol uptake facilitator protein
MLGAFCGATLVYIYYKAHYYITDHAVTKLGTFCTIPAIENKWRNFFCEVVATMLLIFVILAIGNAENTPEVGLGGIGSFPTAMLIMAVGMSLGGTTGYSLNPARDLGPRIAHALLPIKGKGGSDWGYSWVPVMGPLTGAALAALAYCAVYNF